MGIHYVAWSIGFRHAGLIIVHVYQASLSYIEKKKERKRKSKKQKFSQYWLSNVLVLEQPWEIKINIVDITSWFVQTTTHNEKLPGSLAFDEMKRMSCYLLLKVNKFAKIHKLNNSHFDSMYNHKLLSHAFRTWSELKNGPDKPTCKKKKKSNLRHLFSFHCTTVRHCVRIIKED